MLPCHVRILLDYRPALKQRTGVGEYVHELARALAALPDADDLTLLSTSWKDRMPADVRSACPGARVVDRRLPVQLLALAWNRLEWPPVEWLAGACDVAHAQTPLLIPTISAAQVVTIHDLHFLSHPEGSEREIRRDFPGLVRDHAQRADHIIVSSAYAARDVQRRLTVPAAKMTLCEPGPPPWAAAIAEERRTAPAGSVIVFIGTVEPRKNVRGLLAAYGRLRQRRTDAPDLVIAGGVRESARADLASALSPPLAGHVWIRGYVSDVERRQLYRDARLLVLPSLEEGFGLPVLEAMASGVPVVISNRGSLPEVAGPAASPVDPDDVVGLSDAMAALLDRELAAAATAAGLVQSARYSWQTCALAARQAYRAAVTARAERHR
jgi:glycosyltransferase involved in cell wall biosynthesis